MPIYLCNQGEGKAEPWKHHVHVYAVPFDVDATTANTNVQSVPTYQDTRTSIGDSNENVKEGPTATSLPNTIMKTTPEDIKLESTIDTDPNPDASATSIQHAVDKTKHDTSTTSNDPQDIPNNTVNDNIDPTSGSNYQPVQHDNNTNPSKSPLPSSFITATPPTSIRKIRHAEIVLVDDVCVTYNHYWLRLRWPGSKGGFAGYIDMGKTSYYKPTSDESEGKL
jgi:hypothetical protein